VNLKKSSDLIENGIRDNPACNIVPQPTTLPRAPVFNTYLLFYNERYMVPRCHCVYVGI
jgi:hypothetical protein